MKMSFVETQKTGILADFVKTNYRSEAKENEDGTVTIMSYGGREIQGEYYKFSFERVYDIKGVKQVDWLKN